jgi:hypothetical protein
MLLSRVLPNQNLRLRSAFRLRRNSSFQSELSSSQNLQLSNLPTFKHTLDRHCDEKPRIATPLVPSGCKCPLPQPLSLHILTNAPGVWGSSLPFLNSYLNSFCSQPALSGKKPFCKSLIFYSVRTLPSSVSCNSIACHSYENCRVYTNSSRFGTLPLSSTPSPEVPLRA